MSDPYVGRENLEAMKLARKYNAHLVQLVRNAAPGTTALDFGAGAGVFSAALRNLGTVVTCVEPDAELRGELRAMGFTAHHGLSEVPAASLEYVFSLNVLEHIEDDTAIMAELFARLRPGGALLLYVPAFDMLFSAMDRRVGHFRRYRRRPLTAALRAAGFEICDARYADSLGFLATLAYKFIGDPAGGLNVRSLTTYDRYLFPCSRMLDRLIAGAFGKNLVVVAQKPVRDT